MQNGKVNSGNWKSWRSILLVFGILICFLPYEFQSVYLFFLPNKYWYTELIFLILVSALALLRKGTMPQVLKTLLGLQIFGFVIIALAHSNIPSMANPIITLLLGVSMVYYIDHNDGLFEFYKKYNWWILIMAILGTITFFLVTYRDFQPLYFMKSKADGQPIYNFLLTFTKGEYLWGNTFRYAGFFDEPGTMGYWGLFALLFNKLFYNNKRLEYLLIGALLFTFSMGFYLQLAMYLLFFNFSLKNKTRDLIIILFVFILGIGAYSTRGTDASFIYKSTFGRFESLMEESQSNQGSITAVGNRADLERKAKEEFLEEPIFGVENDKEYYADNIYLPLANYGIVGCLFVYAPLIYLFVYARRKKDMDIQKAWLIIMAGFFHRPMTFNLLSAFVIYSMLMLCFKRENRMFV